MTDSSFQETSPTSYNEYIDNLPFHNDDPIDQAWKHNQRGTWLRFPAIMNSIVGLGRLLSSSFIPSSIQQVFNSTSIFAKSCTSVQQGMAF